MSPSPSASPAELAERAVGAATLPCVVIVSVTRTANLRWAASTLTTNGLTGSLSMTVVSVHDSTRAGVVRRTGISTGDVAGLVADAEAAARSASPSEDAAPLAQGGADDDFGHAPVDVVPADLGSLAAGLGAAFDHARSSGIEQFGYAEQDTTTTYLATSTGIRRRHVQPTAVVDLNAKSAGRTRSAWAGTAARLVGEVDVAALATEVEQRLGWQARRLDVEAGRYDTVLPPGAVADLMSWAYLSADVRTAHEGRSAFGRPGGGTRIGESLTDVPLTLRSDPALPGLESSPFVIAGSSGLFGSVFDNGLAVPATDWLRAGRIAALPGTRHSAQLAGVEFRPPADNLELSVEGATGTTADLVGDLDRGLLLTCLWYVRDVDPQTMLLTGLTRDGVYLVEHGEVVGAVTNFRFNDSPLGLLRRIEAAGATVPALGREIGDFFPRTAMPPLRVAGFNCSTVSQAS